MESDKVSESLMDETAAIRLLYPKHTRKHLARLMGVAPGTAREWLYRRMSSARRRELNEALLAECRRQGEELNRLETWLARKASEL